MNAIEYRKTFPVRHEVDVFVAGGGPAGVAAAATAARKGAKVFLAEGHSCLGGMGTAGALGMFCYLTDGVNFVSSGIGTEVIDRLEKARGLAPGSRKESPHGEMRFKPETMKRVYEEMLADAGADFTLHTTLIDTLVTDGVIQHAVCAAKSGLFAVKAKLFIDATGDGDLCAMAGAPFEKGDAAGRMQPGTLCSVWGNIDWEAANAAGHGIWGQSSHLPRAFKDKVFSIEDPHLPGMYPTGDRLGHGNIGHTFGVDGTDERSLTQALIAGRKLILEYERFYKEYLKGYERMELAATGSLLGVRETRRITGDYVLCVDDFKKRAVFDDEIGRFGYPVDLHAPTPDKEAAKKFEEEFHSLRYKAGETYGIPYRSLIPQKLTNALVAGRCVSADRHIQGSIRVMPGCYITGQAAGMAAAIAAESGKTVRQVDPKILRAALKAAGAYIPDTP